MKKILVFLGLIVLFSSCSNEEIESRIDLNDGQNKQVLREISLLIGETLQNKDVRSEIIETINEIDSYGNAVSFALLFGENDRASKFEKRKLEADSEKRFLLKSNSLFKEHLNAVYSSNKDNYLELSKLIQSDESFVRKADLTEIESYLIDEELELYFPYKEKFDWDDLISYTVTFENDNPDGDYEGFRYLGMTFEEVSNIVDDYLYENPTVAIIPIDEDYLGEDLQVTNGNETYYINRNSTFDEFLSFYDNLYGGGLGGSNPGGGGGGSSNPSPQRVRLTQNVNPYTFFNENHVLTCFMPKARIHKGRDWKRLLSKAHRTRIARAGATVAVNPNGGFSALTGTFYFDFDISASDLRNNRWQNVGIMFDPNWHKAKGSQQIVVWTRRKRTSTKSAQVKNEIKIDAQGNYTPAFSISHTFSSSSGTGAVFRGNSELDRDQVLTTLINGSESDNATYYYNGLDLSIRRVSVKFEYFFDIYYTNL